MSDNDTQGTNLFAPSQSVPVTRNDKPKKEIIGKTKKGDKVTLTVNRDKEKKSSEKVKKEDENTKKEIDKLISSSSNLFNEEKQLKELEKEDEKYSEPDKPSKPKQITEDEEESIANRFLYEFMDKEKDKLTPEQERQVLEKEIEILEKVRNLSSLGGSVIDKKGNKKQLLRNQAKESIDLKIKEKNEKKEKLRKKKWWERTFFKDFSGLVGYTEKEIEELLKETPSFLRNIRADLSSPEVAFFTFFCFVSIAIFTITLFSVYNSKTINTEANKDILKQTEGYYIFGIVVLVLFLIFLSLSFGNDEDFKQKIASFVLINGSIFLGAFFTYLDLNKEIKESSSYENLVSKLLIGLFITFLLASVVYILSEQRTGEIGRLIAIIYLLTCIVGFFVLGGATLSFNGRIKIPEGNDMSLLFQLCNIFFTVGILLFISVVIDSIPSINQAVSKAFNRVINTFEPTRIKALIVASVVMMIYYTYTFYKVYNSKYVTGDGTSKFPNVKNKGVNPLINTFSYVGLGAVGAILFSLSLTFGGTIKEKAMAIFLIIFMVSCGSYITYLEGESKIETINNEINTMVIASIAVFMVLLVTSVFYAVFGKRSGTGVFIQDILKVATNFGSLILFFIMFGLCTALSFERFTKTDVSGTPEGVSVWTGFGIGLAIIIIFIISFFVG